MDYTILDDELTNDPLVRGYSTMTDAEVLTDLTTVLYRPANNVIGAMLEYLMSKKHRTNQGADTVYTSIIGRLEHVADSVVGGDPFGRASGGYGGLLLANIHGMKTFRKLFDSQQLEEMYFDDSNLPFGMAEAAGVWSTTHTAALKALSQNQISRAQELLIPEVDLEDIARVRA